MCNPWIEQESINGITLFQHNGCYIRWSSELLQSDLSHECLWIWIHNIIHCLWGYPWLNNIGGFQIKVWRNFRPWGNDRILTICQRDTCISSLSENVLDYYRTLLGYSETSNNGPSERRTTSIQQTNSMPPVTLPIEIEPPRSGHLSTLDNGQPACPQRTAICTKYRRSGFNCEYLLNANREVFKSSQSIDSQE